jgi:transposase
MWYCGLDLAGVSSYAFVTDARGVKEWSGPLETSRLAFERLVKRYRGGFSVAIEAGNQTAWVYEVLLKAGAQATVVNPVKVTAIAESRKKTDKIDAKILCELLRINGLPHPVHMPGAETRALRGLLTARRQLVRTRTKLCNFVRGLLRQSGVSLPARGLASQAAWKRLLAKGFEQMHMALIVAGYYDNFTVVTRSIRELDQQLAEKEQADPRAALLQTMPKVGRIAALTFLAAVDNVQRFPSSRKLIGYTGLAPTVRQSGEHAQYGPITREGRHELRGVWVQIAHLVARDQSSASRPLRRWYDRVAKKRGAKTALVGLARRLLVIAYQILKTETPYDAKKLSKRRTRAV